MSCPCKKPFFAENPTRDLHYRFQNVKYLPAQFPFFRPAVFELTRQTSDLRLQREWLHTEDQADRTRLWLLGFQKKCTFLRNHSILCSYRDAIFITFSLHKPYLKKQRLLYVFFIRTFPFNDAFYNRVISFGQFQSLSEEFFASFWWIHAVKLSCLLAK